jgi:type I restriction enzyme S subunit
VSEIQKLPSSWLEIPLLEVIQTQKGKKPKDLGEITELRTIPYINIKAFEKKIITEYAPEQNAVECNDDDILLVWDGARSGLSGRGIGGYVGSTLARIRSDLVNVHFLSYYFESIYGILNTQTKGVGIPHINPVVLNNLPFHLPPEAEQPRIVEKLDELFSELDAGVKELKAAQIKLTQYRQSLLKSAVEGSLTQKWRETNSDKIQETGEQLLARILKQRRERWEQQKHEEFKAKDKKPPKDWQDKYPEPVKPDTTDLPELPKGWVWASLGQCFRVEVGATPSRKQPSYWGGEIPWASSGEVQFGRVKDTKEKITSDGLKNSSTQINPKGSVLLGMIGEGKTRGQSAILDIDAANNQNCAALWVPESGISSEYVFYWLWSQYENTRSSSSGNNQPALNKSLVEKMPIAISSLNEMAYIGSYLSAEFTNSDKKSSDLLFTLKQAEAQRKNILKCAFSGKLVPQDPNDEPASELLEKIRLEREALANKPNTKEQKKNTIMKKISIDELTKWVGDYKGDCFTFGELQKAFQDDYDQLKDCVFEMLDAKKPLFKQVFDKEINAIKFIKEEK